MQIIDHLKTIRSDLVSLHGIVGDFSKSLAAIDSLEQAIREPCTLLDMTLTNDEAEYIAAFTNKYQEKDDDVVRLIVGSGHSGYGLYASDPNYAEEGSVFIKLLPAPAAAPPVQQAQVELAPTCVPGECKTVDLCKVECQCLVRDIKPAQAEQEKMKLQRKVLSDALSSWMVKTEWVLDYIQPEDIGLHRADMVRRRVDRLEAENKQLYEMMQIKRTKVIDAAVNKFLGWKLPFDFAPDAGISYDQAYRDKWGLPTGTNLFTAEQAKYMFKHCLSDTLIGSQQPKEKP